MLLTGCINPLTPAAELQAAEAFGSAALLFERAD
jgi:hypothetical protein